MTRNLPSDKIDFHPAMIEWDTETEKRLTAKGFLSPDDYIGAIIKGEKSHHRIQSIEAVGGTSVVFNLLNLDTGKLDSVMKCPRSTFDPEPILKKRLNQALQDIKTDPDRVIQICDKILELNLNNDTAAFNKAVALSIKGEIEQALECFDLAIVCAPEDFVNWLNKAVTLSQLGRHREVLEHLLIAVSFDSEGVKSYLKKISTQAEKLEFSINAVLRDNPKNESAKHALVNYFA